MLLRRYSARQLADHAGLALPTVTFLIKEGVLEPSIQRAAGRGHGNVFSFADVVAAKSLAALRLPSAAAAPISQIIRFWHTPEGAELAQRLFYNPDKDKRCVLLVTDAGVDVDLAPADVMEKRETKVVFCIDAAHMVEGLTLDVTTKMMVMGSEAYGEPGASGRVPSVTRKKSMRKHWKEKKTMEQIAAGRRERAKTRKRKRPTVKAAAKRKTAAKKTRRTS